MEPFTSPRSFLLAYSSVQNIQLAGLSFYPELTATFTSHSDKHMIWQQIISAVASLRPTIVKTREAHIRDSKVNAKAWIDGKDVST